MNAPVLNFEQPVSEALTANAIDGAGQAIAASVSLTTCEYCGGPFTPRSASGGKPQRFCSAQCRQLAHKASKTTGDPNVNPQLDEPTATQRRSMMIEAVKDFDAKQPSAEEAVNTFISRPLVPTPDRDEQFSWSAVEDDIIIREQPNTAVYWNSRGQIVIRQERAWNEDDDPFLFFDPNNIPRLIERLQVEYDSWKSDA